MKALVFRNSLPRQAAATLGGRLTPRAYVGRFAPIQLEEVPEPVPPGEGWVVCDTVLTGICGSDTKQMLLHGARDNPLTALISFPHILGHEAVARRADTGERVVLNPWLSCGPRGIDPPCAACKAGRYPQCRNFRRGLLPPALHLGNCSGAGGVHAERFCAHESQLFTVPDDIGDEAAVLADPASVSLHSLLLGPPAPRLPAMVYGCGTLGLAAIGLLRYLHPTLEIWAVSRPGAGAELAAKLGADVVLPSRPEDLVTAVAAQRDVTPLVPWSGKRWLQDGPGVVYDTVGSPETVETSMRCLTTGGSLVITGVEAPARFEWTPLYFKELHVVGSNAFGVEEVGGVRQHAFGHYLEMVRGGLDLTPLVTHRFPLEQWDRALLTITDRKRTGAVKVLLEP